MFTGIVLERGRLIADPEPSPHGGLWLSLAYSRELGERVSVGASLAVAGVCLTLVEHRPEGCAVELSRETIARTRLGRLRQGDEVNLEPALRLGDALGGHWVQGHVDGLAELVRRDDREEHSEFTFAIPRGMEPYLIEKGSVALDGVSLTIAALDADTFRIALIPHTLSVTTLGSARPGELLHFEADALAKYVERILVLRTAKAPEGSSVS